MACMLFGSDCSNQLLKDICAVLKQHMEQALEHGEFQMFLQPKMGLRQKCLSGAEALVR